MAPASCATLLRLSQAAAGLSHMRRKYLGCHPGRSAARSGALQTRDPSIPASEKRHGRGTWIPALATLGRDDNGGNGAICDCPALSAERKSLRRAVFPMTRRACTLLIPSPERGREGVGGAGLRVR